MKPVQPIKIQLTCIIRVTTATLVRFVYFYRDIYVGTSEAGFAGTYANFQIFTLR